MVKKILCAIIAILSIFSCLDMPSSFAGTQASAYLCDIGVTCYELGKYEEALSEFNKVLLIEPGNKTAQEYINKIFEDENRPLISGQFAAEKTSQQTAETAASFGPYSSNDREQAIDDSFDKIAGAFSAPDKSQPKAAADEKEKRANYKIGPIDITGEVQLRAGFTPKDAIWKMANWDLNEKNWRMLSVDGYNEMQDTYDRRIYDRLRVNFDSANTEGFGMHSSMVVDPWSFTGKTDKVTIPGLGGDAAEIQLKYWSNTRYTLNENFWTLTNGDSINVPEIKVYDNNTTIPVTVTSDFGNIFSIPKLKIHREFQPVRQMIFDYKTGGLKIEAFPFAYEDKAVTFDDPLRLSNNRIWWENSPWINGWTHGMYNSGPGDFTRGFWDMDLPFFARDSEGQRLTSLRGMTLNFDSGEKLSFVSSVASPRNPWQDIAEVDNVILANRMKYFLRDNLRIGAIYTSRFGFNIDHDYQTDARNYVAATDISYEVIDGLMASAEFASSKSYNDISNAQYKSEDTGNSYYVSLMGRFPRESIINTEYGYDGIKANAEDRFFNKFRFFATRMDKGFQ